MASDQASVSGSCLCGAIRFSVRPPTLYCVHCHCTLCRRQHGAGYVTWFGIARERFSVDRGAGVLGRHRSSEHATRSFCTRCGTPLFFETERHPERLDVVLANLEGRIDRAPEAHVFFDDRAPWVPVDDDLPRLGGESGLEPLGSDG